MKYKFSAPTARFAGPANLLTSPALVLNGGQLQFRANPVTLTPVGPFGAGMFPPGTASTPEEWMIFVDGLYANTVTPSVIAAQQKTAQAQTVLNTLNYRPANPLTTTLPTALTQTAAYPGAYITAATASGGTGSNQMSSISPLLPAQTGQPAVISTPVGGGYIVGQGSNSAQTYVPAGYSIPYNGTPGANYTPQSGLVSGTVYGSSGNGIYAGVNPNAPGFVQGQNYYPPGYSQLQKSLNNNNCPGCSVSVNGISPTTGIPGKVWGS